MSKRIVQVIGEDQRIEVSSFYGNGYDLVAVTRIWFYLFAFMLWVNLGVDAERFIVWAVHL